MAAQDLDEWLEAALHIAREAGAVSSAFFAFRASILLFPLSRPSQVALEGYHRVKQVKEKASSADLVTETDKKVEELIKNYIAKKFPSHKLASPTLSCHVQCV